MQRVRMPDHGERQGPRRGTAMRDPEEFYGEEEPIAPCSPQDFHPREPVPEGHRTTRRCRWFGHRLQKHGAYVICKRRKCDGPCHRMRRVHLRSTSRLYFYECEAPWCEFAQEITVPQDVERAWQQTEEDQ